MVSDEQALTVGLARAMGYLLPAEWPDDLAVSPSRHLSADTGVMVQVVTVYAKGHVGRIKTEVKIEGDE